MLQKYFFAPFLLLCLIFSCPPIGSVRAEKNLPEKGSDHTAEVRDLKRDPFELTPALQDYIKARNPDTTPRDFEPTKVKVTGIMIVRDRIMATAEIEQIGEMALKPGMQVNVTKKDTPAISFTVKEISSRGVVVVFENGDEVLYEYE
ncbi:MAG: hypothetical protein JRJ42_09140 [Deltaproteobacteria bacterium]|nr:hypothetical protein [Deltaproteobacteria bacterium]MBW2020516.1 hypothetical protein [Deltaproteobacteria bacterium]MBW2075543.1 hypothetical protein [Deltaproteobacteria bacterium]RLB83457.1 MAG: hypothetical protein DRH17_02240 [Deltaproteobacteria bacterium]